MPAIWSNGAPAVKGICAGGKTNIPLPQKSSPMTSPLVSTTTRRRKANSPDGTGDGNGSLQRLPYCPSHTGLDRLVMLYTAILSFPMSLTYAIVPAGLKATLYGKLSWLLPCPPAVPSPSTTFGLVVQTPAFVTANALIWFSWYAETQM